MSDWFLAAVPGYGPWLLAAVTFLSCLALPLPASLLMLTAGGFAAAGDLSLWQIALAALLGAVGGDQAGFWAGRAGGRRILSRLARSPGRAAALDQARALVAKRGAAAVFLTRWLLSPLGPWANLVTGATGFGWLRFTLPGVAGEAIWVGVYCGAGYVFGDNLPAAMDFAGSLLGFLAAGVLALGLGAWLLHLSRREIR
jgi:membrane-associated protein